MGNEAELAGALVTKTAPCTLHYMSIVYPGIYRIKTAIKAESVLDKTTMEACETRGLRFKWTSAKVYQKGSVLGPN